MRIGSKFPRTCIVYAVIAVVSVLGVTAALTVDYLREPNLRSDPSTGAGEWPAVRASGSMNVLGFDARKLRITGTVVQMRRATVSPELTLRTERGRLASATFLPGANLRSLETGNVINLRCQSVRVIGSAQPRLDLGGCKLID